MYSSFSQLKKATSMGELTKKLVEEAEKMSTSSSSRDDRIFTVERDSKTGNGFAIVRFMPPPPNEPSSFVKLVNHNFIYNGKYLNENCPKYTPGVKGDCPICESNREIWATEIKANQEIASLRKLKTSYFMNVYIVKNPAKPELEGKVMLYRCGVKIFEKIENARKEKYEGDTNIIEPFDLFEDGANFRIVVKTVKDSKNKRDYPDYADSAFETKGALLGGDDEKLEALWNQCYSLQDLIAPDKFHSYDDIQKNLNRVMNAKPAPSSDSVQQQEQELDTLVNEVKDEDIMEELAATYKSRATAVAAAPATVDEAVSAFQALAEDDDIPF
jgi:hypothetical protein